MKSTQAESLKLVRLCCRALDDKKAGDVSVIDVTDCSSITDYLVIATATSEPHVRALRVELEKVLDAAKAHIVGVDTSLESGWVVMDAFDVMVHVFTPDTRSRYSLESLWKDGQEIEVESLLSDGPPKKKAKAKKTPAAAKKPALKKKKAPSKKKAK